MFYTIFTAVYAVLYGLLEIEIEGPDGWTWYTATSPLIGTFTGYHFLMACIVLLTLLPVWQSSGFVRYVFHVMAWFAIEDTTWFVVNPNYGLWNMDKVWWFDSIVVVPSWFVLVIMIILYMAFGGVRIPVRDAVVFSLTLPGVWLFSWVYWPFYTFLHPYHFLYEYDVIKELRANETHDNHSFRLVMLAVVAALCFVWVFFWDVSPPRRRPRVTYMRISHTQIP